eukprot:TRINITY_DN18163_c0_g1_i1.p1 TRINITY_DN18163_c0_g1~~TRINITY_DN18163_c0_g1_i1.p1  ORF type:complete len:178 (-),score=24.03 TRINITY_DN18163_c0_g1_i1:61-525(-)
MLSLNQKLFTAHQNNSLLNESSSFIDQILKIGNTVTDEDDLFLQNYWMNHMDKNENASDLKQFYDIANLFAEYVDTFAHRNIDSESVNDDLKLLVLNVTKTAYKDAIKLPDLFMNVENFGVLNVYQGFLIEVASTECDQSLYSKFSDDLLCRND